MAAFISAQLGMLAFTSWGVSAQVSMFGAAAASAAASAAATEDPAAVLTLILSVASSKTKSSGLREIPLTTLFKSIILFPC
jgi:hypothetical protein